MQLVPSVLNHEDRVALDGGDDDGLVVIKEIIKNCSILYKHKYNNQPNNVDIVVARKKKLYLEIGLEQIEILKNWCFSEEGQIYCDNSSSTSMKDENITSKCIDIFKDFTDRDRFVCIYIK